MLGSKEELNEELVLFSRLIALNVDKMHKVISDQAKVAAIVGFTSRCTSRSTSKSTARSTVRSSAGDERRTRKTEKGKLIKEMINLLTPMGKWPESKLLLNVFSKECLHKHPEMPR